MLKNKKLLVSIGIGAAVLLTVIGYFVVTPAVQVGGYKQQVTTGHPKLNEAVSKLAAVQNRDSFVKSGVEGSVMRSDAKIGYDAIKDVEAALSAYEKQLTSFAALPLLEWNGAYKAAGEIDTKEQTYVATTREYVTEMRAVLDYLEKNAGLYDKTQAWVKESESMASPTTADELNRYLETLIKKLEEIVADAEKMTAPESLAESHAEQIQAVKDILTLFRDFAAAVKAEDYDKMTQLERQFATKQSEVTGKSGVWTDKFLKESKLAKLGDSLKNLHREIEANLGKL